MTSTRLFFRIHSWLGLITGALMFVIVLSGVYLVYRAEFDRYFNPQIRVRPAAVHPVPIDTVLGAARRAFPAYNVGYVMFPGNATSPCTVYLREIAADGVPLRRLGFMTAALHYGDFWGDYSKVPYVIGGLVLTFLAVSGLWIRFRPRRTHAISGG